jgi:hypothetical protein
VLVELLLGGVGGVGVGGGVGVVMFVPNVLFKLTVWLDFVEVD